MGTWNEDALLALGGGGSSGAANAAALQAIKDSNAQVQASNAQVRDRIPPTTATATVTARTLAATTSTLLLAANVNRQGATIQNDSGQVLLVAFGAASGASTYTAKIASGAYYELPFRYTGVVNGFMAAASTAPGVLVTELTV